METQHIANTLHSLNVKALKKTIAACTIAVIAVSMLAALSATTVSADASSMALRTQDQYILDENGNTVYLRGMGLAGFAPDLILWGQGESDTWGVQWNTDTGVIDQTFASMRDEWDINMIRVFVLPSWYYRDNIIPAVEDPASYGSLTTPISTKAYLRTLCEEAGKYGIYVDITPYMLTPSASSFGADPYASTGFGWQGMPMMGWDDAANRFLSDAGYAGNELGFWNWFWTDMANNLKDYPNAIFEAWNEPNVGGDADPIPEGYMTYLETMYSAVRSTGATNLVMMQWHMGWFPNGYGNDLSWCKQISDAIPDANNLVYTTHLYYYAPTDLTSYWATDYDGLKTQLQQGVATMGVTAPLVINEEGSCLNSSPNHQSDLVWWTNLLAAQRDLGLGAGAYYWLSDSGLGGVYSGESMLSSGYSPNAMGQAYIDAYVPSASAPVETATSTPAATQESTSTVQPTATTSSETKQSTTDLAPTQTTTPTPTATSEPTTQTNNGDKQLPAQSSNIFDAFNSRNWIFFSWMRYNHWFAIRYW